MIGLLGGVKPHGYAVQPRNHNAVAAAVVQGRADWGMTLDTIARNAGLGFLPVQEEQYDFIVPVSRANRPGVVAFTKLLQQASTREALVRLGMKAMSAEGLAGGIVLCGGKSTRMGVPKATLPFGPETMLQRVVRLLGTVVSPIVVVAAREQSLPELPADVKITHDEREQRGPLEGLRAGLKALPDSVDVAYITSCDVPLLEPAFVERMVELLGDHDIAVMEIDGFPHPLSAVYRRDTLPHVEALLEKDKLRPVFLFDAVRTRRVRPEEMLSVDPQLRTLRNLNTREDYLAALAEAGYQAPLTMVFAHQRIEPFAAE